MDKLSILVGEHLLQVKMNSAKTMNFFRKKYNHFIVQEGKTDLYIILEEGYGVPFLNYQVEIVETKNNITFKRADYLIEIDTDYKQAKIQFYDELSLKHALMNLYSCFIVHNNWGLLVHSSCALENGNAHVFAGHSGAGKSTTAKLSQPRELLSDEATILKISQDQITVFNSPFRSELASDGNTRSTNLNSIQILNQALSNKRVTLKKREALIQLTDKVFYWAYRPTETLKILNLLKDLVNNVHTYELYFRKDNTFWELISC
ncbi:hypothetical protein IM538_16815 [Cytobacillus suaedae]|nr:hypothetical protein IM538_16815 [Cytobacillus suaedae]